jgi:hypothetical protein
MFLDDGETKSAAGAVPRGRTPRETLEYSRLFAGRNPRACIINTEEKVRLILVEDDCSCATRVITGIFQQIDENAFDATSVEEDFVIGTAGPQ